MRISHVSPSDRRRCASRPSWPPPCSSPPWPPAPCVAGASFVAGPVAIVVAQDGSGTHETITEAVAAAQAGDTVLVRPGIYVESIAIDKDITVRGDGDRGAVVLEFSADGPTRGEFAYGILLDKSAAHVENLTVRGPADVLDEPALSAVYVDGGAPVLERIDVVLAGDRWDYGSGSYYKRSAIQIRGDRARSSATAPGTATRGSTEESTPRRSKAT